MGLVTVSVLEAVLSAQPRLTVSKLAGTSSHAMPQSGPRARTPLSIAAANVARCLCALGFASLLICVQEAAAQGLAPSRANVFAADDLAKAEESKARKKALSSTTPPAAGLDFQAPMIEFNRETNEVVGKGGILIAEGGVQVQADEGSFNMETKEGTVTGNVLMTTSAGVLSASSADVNVPNETGTFHDLSFEVEEGGFTLESKRARKISEFDFQLEDMMLTSCHCGDGTRPWEFRGSSCNLTQEGYAHLKDSTFWFEGMPVFYSPYLSVPAKRERASGLLFPSAGYSNQNGFLYRQPIFFDFDDTAGATLTPFVATSARVGAGLEVEKRFSTRHSLDAGFIYSNESLRDGSAKGLDLSAFADPTIDTNRTGGFYNERWRSDPQAGAPSEIILDGRYTSDDLFLREIPAPQIGMPQAQFLTSTALARVQPYSFLNTELRAEYNQMLTTPQDLQFQRLPEVAVSAGETFRPFGANPYGLKVVTEIAAVGTDFYREQYYDGLRLDISPKVTVPFHVKNFVRAQFSVQLHQTEYSMNNTEQPPPTYTPGTTPEPTPTPLPNLEDSMSRTLPILSYTMTSGVERVFSLDRDSWFSKAVGLGVRNEGTELVRLKHTIEPTFGYTYIPSVNQDNNPLYDELDRFRERSLFSYGFTTRLFGKAQEPLERVREVEELAPSAETIPMYDLSDSLLAFGRGMLVAPPALMDVREGATRQLAQFTMKQTYDALVDRANDDPSLNAFSDIYAGGTLSPSFYFSTGFDSNFMAEEGQFASFAYLLGFRDDRDDSLRLRYNYINNTSSTNQIEGNIESKISEQLRVGLYGRYDFDQAQFLESRGLFRFVNSCKCWSADLGMLQSFNPDNKQFLFSFTLGGLGGPSQPGALTQY